MQFQINEMDTILVGGFKPFDKYYIVTVDDFPRYDTVENKIFFET